VTPPTGRNEKIKKRRAGKKRFGPPCSISLLSKSPNKWGIGGDEKGEKGKRMIRLVSLSLQMA